MVEISSEDYNNLELYHIANSGVNGTCIHNPCKNDALCFYTTSLNDYFCQCSTCYSGPFCDKESCNSEDVNLSYFKNLKMIRLNESSYYAIALLFIIFIVAVWRSIKLYKRFETNSKESKSEKFEKEYYLDDQESMTTNLLMS
ncbi:Epidermal growth factor-like domain-containing protein [Strongyloides ratti]|uniref:Epidermal growth factor-like domain-containing protein n=1 Tax=Strongyloides ratti TaxID=34506 RepID=A0A090L5Q7_STRRB|nr:Epidermal growth factor-like domain-containing protein [Strongyloides ratti]CEF63452.1 Epidermal growth factor-like domain-containing protein [Strongyloides ratti]